MTALTGAFCTAPASDRFAARLLADTDCQAFGLIERGYAALAQPGSSVSLALTGMMVIAVAFFGYRLLLGRGVVLADAIGLTIKLGVVLVIATSWEAWQVLAYQGLAQAPSEVASAMLVAIGAPPPLESLQRTLDNLNQAGIGYRMRAGIASPLVGGPAAAAAVLNLSAILMTLTTVGVMVAMRVVLAILLAIAPAMAGFLLFDATRGMAQGWLAAMAAAALAPLFILIVAALQFAILSPMVATLLAEQAAGTFENSAVMPIGLVTVVFAIALVIAVRAGGKIAHGIRLSFGRAPTLNTNESTTGRTLVDQRAAAAAASAPQVSRALESAARRDSPVAAVRARPMGGMRASSTLRDAPAAVAPSPTATIHMLTPPRGTGRLRSPPRRSRAAARRDK